MILCIDDDPLVRRMVKAILEVANYECRTAGNAREALVAIAADKPDLILLDLGLPETDGFDLYKSIRLFSGQANTPIVILSASTTPIDIRRALGMGAEDYLLKPVVPALLTAKIEQIYARQAATRPAMSATLSEAPDIVARAAQNPDNLVDKYILVETIGSGGMGDVLKAWDSTLQKWAALKFLRGPVDPVSIQRLYREARIVARLHHENICPVYDLRTHNGSHYIAMEYIEGENAARQFAPREAGRVIEKVARALHHAHLEGVIHRDLKPANILCDAMGKPWLTDFGISKMPGLDSRLTPSGLVIGSPCYLAPELLEGSVADERSDVYALGATLYEMVVGSAPYDVEDVSTRQIFRDIAVANLTPPAALVDGLPPALERIILTAMASRRRRYGSAREMADALLEFLDEAATAPKRRWPLGAW